MFYEPDIDGGPEADERLPPQLEVISSIPEGEGVRPTPVLFVHGAFTGAWVWAEHFLPYFSRRGWCAHAVSLRGHGSSEGHERLLWTSLREYVADVARVVADLERTPIMVGHSMGGMVIQKYLERAAIPAAVLMASVPPEGVLGSIIWLALRDPLLFQELSLIHWGGPHFATVNGVRRAIFSPDLPPRRVAGYFSRMQAESQRVALDLCGYDVPRLPAERPPALVLRAGRDALVPPAAVESTARAFGTRSEVFPDLAHAMMLETGWEAVAERIVAWLDELGL